MNELITQIKTYLQGLEIPTEEYEKFLDEILISSKSNDNEVYKVSEKHMIDTLTTAILNLDLEGKTIDQQKVSLRRAFGPYSDIGELHDINNRNLPISFGKEMEKLYFDEDYIIGIHGTAMPEEDVQDKIFNDGLISTRGPIHSTTIATKEGTLTFKQFIEYSYKSNSTEAAIIIRIPKDEINSPMWKQEGEYYYLNPAYIYGYYISHYQAVFNDNPEIIYNMNYGQELYGYNIENETYEDDYSL